jgi:hypothetical protein
MITVTVRFRNGQELEYVLSRQTEKLSGIKIVPEELALETGMEKEVQCLTRLGAKPPTATWLQGNTPVLNTTYISVYGHELTLRYNEELNGVTFECKVENFTEPLPVSVVIVGASSDDDGLSGGATAGIIVAVILVLILLVILIYIYCVTVKRKREGQFKPKSDSESKTEQGAQAGQVPPSLGSGVRSYSYEMKEDPRYAPSDPVAPQSSDDIEKVPPNDEDAVFSPGEPGPGENEADGADSKHTVV